MATLMELDETFCKTPVCQHPQCWVTIRRIKQGHPRYRPLGSVTRTPRMDPAGMPVLSVTTLPINQILPNEQKVKCASSQVTFFQMASPSMQKLYNSATSSKDKILFPGLNSYSEITAAPRSAASFISTKKSWGVTTVDSCLQDIKTTQTTMVWVPNPQQKSQKQQKREKPLSVQIKELTFTDMCGQLRRDSRNSDVPKIRKVNKPPTGGRPHNLILLDSPMHTHTRKLMIASSMKENQIFRIKKRSNDNCSYSVSQPDSGLDSLILENRRVILHDNRSRNHSSLTMSQSGPVYRMDQQNLESMDVAGIDLNRIRNQYYLWKKYIGLSGPNFKIQPQPTGSVVCDTERSHELDSRDSPSSAGFSQASWAEAEPCDAPADLFPRKISEHDFPGEQAEESDQLRDNENTSQKLPDLQSEHLLEEEESVEEYELSDKSEAVIQDSEVTDEPNSSEKALSPQPNPPPPSPSQGTMN